MTLSRTSLFLALAILTLARAVLVIWAGVSPESAYFYLCGEHPAWGYFDGPAGTAMVVHALAPLGEGWIFLGPVSALLASLAAWRLGVRVYGENAAALGTLALNLVPSWNAAAFSVSPQMLALTFTLLAASIAWDGCRNQHPSFFRWVVAAMAFGGATLFAFWPSAVAMACALTPLCRKGSCKTVNIAGAAVVVTCVVLALLPTLIWNAHQDWVPLAGWTLRSLLAPNFAAILLGVGALLAGISPLLALFSVPTFAGLTASAREKVTSTFAVLLALPGTLAALAFAYRGWDGSVLALSALAVLLPAMALHLRKLWWVLSLVVAVGFSIPVWLAYPSRSASPAMAARAVATLEEKLSPQIPEGLFFVASTPELASALGYHLRQTFIAPENHPRVYSLASQDMDSQFALWPSYDDFIETAEAPDEYHQEHKAVNPYIGHSALYVGHQAPDDLPTSLRSAFSELQLVQEIGNGKTRLFIYLCLDYQTLPL